MAEPGSNPSRTLPARRQLEPPSSDDRPLWDIYFAAHDYAVLCAADELDLFRLLQGAPLAAAEVGAQLGLGSRATEVLLGKLAVLGLLTQQQGRFALTPLARTYLLPDSPYYRGAQLRAARTRPITYEHVLTALRQDQPVFTETQDGWETQDFAPAAARTFTDVMFALSVPVAMATVRLGVFAGVRQLLDVGGGSGSWCIALAQRHPEIRCTVLELPPVCRVAEEYIARYGVQEQVRTVAGEMFTDEWPAGHDAVFFGQVFHDWDVDRCAQLARNAYATLPSGGRVYLNEMVLGDGRDGPASAVGMSLAMLLQTRGKQYTAQELHDLLGAAGFVDITILPTYGYWSLIRGRKP